MLKDFKKTIGISIALATIVTTISTVQAHAEWQKDSTGWSYSNGSSYDIGWNSIEGKWYYFDNNGHMQTGWIEDCGLWYYLYEDGSMAHDTTIGDYYVNSNGAWVSTQKANFVSYDEEIVFECPSNWTKNDITGVDTYLLDDKGTFVNIVSESLDSKSIDEYCNYYDNSVKANLNVETIKSQDLVINDKNARLISYSYNLGDQRIETSQMFLFNNNRAYIFTLSSLTSTKLEDLENFIKMMSTVSFK